MIGKEISFRADTVCVRPCSSDRGQIESFVQNRAILMPAKMAPTILMILGTNLVWGKGYLWDDSLATRGASKIQTFDPLYRLQQNFSKI